MMVQWSPADAGGRELTNSAETRKSLEIAKKWMKYAPSGSRPGLPESDAAFLAGNAAIAFS